MGSYVINIWNNGIVYRTTTGTISTTKTTTGHYKQNGKISPHQMLQTIAANHNERINRFRVGLLTPSPLQNEREKSIFIRVLFTGIFGVLIKISRSLPLNKLNIQFFTYWDGQVYFCIETLSCSNLRHGGTYARTYTRGQQILPTRRQCFCINIVYRIPIPIHRAAVQFVNKHYQFSWERGGGEAIFVE